MEGDIIYLAPNAPINEKVSSQVVIKTTSLCSNDHSFDIDPESNNCWELIVHPNELILKSNWTEKHYPMNSITSWTIHYRDIGEEDVASDQSHIVVQEKEEV